MKLKSPLLFSLAMAATSLTAATAVSAAEALVPKLGRWQEMKGIYEHVTGDIVPATGIYHSVVDLNGSGTNEVILRDGTRCNDVSSCRYVIAAYDEKTGWKQVGEYYGASISLEDADEGAWRDLVISESLGRSATQVTLTWTGERYAADLSSYGDLMPWQDASEMFSARGEEDRLESILNRSMPGDTYLIMSSTGVSPKIEIAGADLNYDGTPEYFLKITHPTFEQSIVMIFKAIDAPPFASFRIGASDIAVSREVDETRLKTLVTNSPEGGVRKLTWNPAGGRYE
ncbi:hypothetical protein [Salipiger sp. PrR003]|uniref:hypothetical protein n=1 Tax=Salipiger sp. PrR003 TaxID=2706776 RepID=UPI0013DC1723|nr:hypothetical protein [Salipiger sp. PrR003]NDV52865.1 hypothetical protein [Salipiger sp. PrR003]